MIDNQAEKAKVAGLIVRHIGDIEAAYDLAVGELNEQLWKEIDKKLYRAGTDSEIWLDHEIKVKKRRHDDKNNSISQPDWQNPAKIGSWDFWLELDGYEEIDHSWLSYITSNDPNGLGLYFYNRFSEGDILKAILKKTPKLTDKLLSLGFKLQDDGYYLYIPIRIDREKLAWAFENDDFSDALEPVAEAVRTATKALDPLNQLAALIRATQAT